MKITEAIPQLPCITTHAVVVDAGYSDTCKPVDRTSLHDIVQTRHEARQSCVNLTDGNRGHTGQRRAGQAAALSSAVSAGRRLRRVRELYLLTYKACPPAIHDRSCDIELMVLALQSGCGRPQKPVAALGLCADSLQQTPRCHTCSCRV